MSGQGRRLRQGTHVATPTCCHLLPPAAGGPEHTPGGASGPDKGLQVASPGLGQTGLRSQGPRASGADWPTPSLLLRV